MLGLALKFKVTGATILLIVTSLVYLASQSQVFATAGINQTINFQGKVVNSDGTNVTNGNYDFTFRLYKVSTSGTVQWTENWTGGNQVPVSDGIFRVALGTHTSMSSLDFNDDSWYLSIEFNGDGEMDPRIRFASVPFAFNAKTVGGLTVTNTTGTLTIPNSTTISFAGAFTTSGANALTLTTTGSTNVTLPTTGTLATLAGNEVFTNKTIGSTGLTFSGASLDLTTATDEDLTITPNGAGNAVFNLATTGDFLIQDASTSFVQFLDDGTITLGKGSGAGTINIGTGTAADVLNFGSDNTAGDTIVIGNSNASTTLALAGGDDWSISTTGNAIFAGTTGISLTGTGADLIFPNLERITNDTNGTITFARNDAGTVTLTAADDDATAALSILSGGAAAMTVDAGGAAALNLGNTNATSITLGNSSTTAVDLIAGSATVNIADNATTKTIDLGGVTNSGTDTINIATNGTAADTISIGNTHASTALTLTGGDDWLITATGSAHMSAWEGGGLYDDCNAQLSKITWDSVTKTFSCATDVLGSAATPDVATFVDTTAVAWADNNTTELYNDNPRPNITTDSSTAPVLVAVQIRGDISNTTADAFLAARVVFTNDGSAPSCTTSTQAGQAMIGGFTTNTTHPWQVVGTFIHTPGAGGLIRYTVCTSALSVGTATDTPEAVQVSLTELGNANSNWTSDSSTGTLKQNITTLDVLVGGETTGSAKFAVLGMATGAAPSASVSATSGSNVGKGTVISGTGSIQSLSGGTLTVGGNTSGNIVLSPRNSAVGSSVAPGADDAVDLGSSSSARFRNLFLGPNSLHLQCLTADGCGQNLDYALSINSATNALYISANGGAQSLSIQEGGEVNVASTLYVGTGNAFQVDANGDVVTSGDVNVGSGTIYASVFDAVGATGITVGSGDVTGITVTTDGTGDAEVALPAQSIGASEILNDAITATQLSSVIQFADNDLLDLSAITHNDSGAQGLILPQAASFTNPSTGEGYLVWNSNSELVEVYNGAAWVPVGNEYDFDDIYATSVAGTNTTMEIDNTLGLEFDLTTSGDFVISDSGTAFVQYLDDGTITLGKASAASTINIGAGTGVDTINIGTGASGADVITVGGGSGTLGINTSNLTLTTAGLLTMYDTVELSGGTNEGIRGGGLVDCDAATDKLLWDSTSNKFSCGTDSYIASTFDAYDNTGGQTVNSTPVTMNIDATRRSHSNYTLAADVVTVNSDGVYEIRYEGTVENATGSTGDTRFYIEIDTGSGFAEEDGSSCWAFNESTTTAGTCGRTIVVDLVNTDDIRLRAVSGANTGTTVADASSLTISKLEDTVGGGGAGTGITVRETDSSPSVSDADTLEFGPSSSSSDEFIITDQTGGVARVRLGNEVGMLNQNETVSGAWIFNGTNTTFSTGLIANGGLTSASGTNFSVTPGGTGDFVVNLDADTNVQFAAGAAPGVDMFSLSNVGFGTTTDNVDGLQIDFITTAVAGTRNNAGLQINVTSGATEGVDNLYGINIANLTSPSSGTEVGLSIGTGWDTGIVVQGGGISVVADGITVSAGGLTISAGDLIVDGDSIISDGATLVINASGEVEIQDNLEVTGTTGITLSGANSALVLSNAEEVSNDTDDEIVFTGTGGSNNAGLIIDLDGATNAVPTLRSAANDLINIFDGLSIGIDGATAHNISLSGFAISGGNDLYVDDQFGVNGNVYIDGAIETVGGLTFNGTVVDITSDTDEDLTFTPNGTGGLIFSSDFNSTVKIGSSTNTPAVLSVSGGIGNNAAAIINQTNNGDILVASASGATKFVIDKNGGVGIGTTTPKGLLDISGNGRDNAALIVNQTGTQDILAASASGTTRFAIENDGTVQLDTTKYANCDGLNADSAGNLQCGAIMIRKAATEGITGSTALQDDNELLFSIGANETWVVQVNFLYTTNAAASNDIRVGLNNTAAGATCDYSAVDLSHAGNLAAGETTACNTAIIMATTATGEKGGVLTGTVTSGGGSGTVAFRWAQGTNDGANATTVEIGSSLVAWKINGADLAEVYYSKEGILAPGTVVKLDSTLDAGVQTSKSPYEKGLVGVVTTNPSIVMGDPTSSTHGTPIVVALSGRIPVKVSTENGAILPGDLLTSSSTPGVAMKATKAGVVIGQAMNGYEGGGVGEVVMFVKNTQSLGSAGFSIQDDNRGQVLSSLIQSIGTQESTEVSLSEINTDLLVAGREIVTPVLTAETLFTTTIQAVEGNGLIVKFDDDGGVGFVNPDTNVAVISFDKNGNAFFAGTITAGKVQAGEIEGMEIIAGSISQLEGSMASLSGMIATGSANLQVDNNFNLTSYQSLDLAGGLTVGYTAVFKGESIFEKFATFIGKVVFKNKVKFEKTPEFSRDTAGFAVIKAGDSRVHVEFEDQYYYTPVITANIVLNQELNPDGTQVDRSELERAIFNDDYQILISNRSAKGFDIVLNNTAQTDIPISWTALASFNASTFQTGGVAGFSATPTPPETSLITPQNSGAVSPENTPDPDESLSQAPAQSGQSSVSSEPTEVPNEVNTTSTGSGVEEGGENL